MQNLQWLLTPVILPKIGKTPAPSEAGGLEWCGSQLAVKLKFADSFLCRFGKKQRKKPEGFGFFAESGFFAKSLL